MIQFFCVTFSNKVTHKSHHKLENLQIIMHFLNSTLMEIYEVIK